MQGVSVVVCAFNAINRLKPTLESIVAQQVDGFDWELIIVDNASTDDTGEFCKNYLNQNAKGIEWYVVNEPKPGLNNARMLGLLTARYHVVLFCDDDNHLSENYIAIGFGLMKAHKAIGALGGNGQPLFEVEKPEWFDKYAHSFAVGPQAEQSGKINEMPAEVYGAGCFFRAEPLKQLFASGFQTIMSDRLGNTLASGGDVEWCYLVQLLGYEVWYDERLTFKHVMTAPRLAWEYYLKLKQGISSGAARLFLYQQFFKNDSVSDGEFLEIWNSYKRKLMLQHKKLLMKNMIAAKDPEMQIATTTNAARRMAFSLDYQKAVQHLHQLRRYLHN